MILIAESGSTKTEWIISENGKAVCHAETSGINPFLHDESTLKSTIEELPAMFFESKFDAIYFYGAGCISPQVNKKLVRLLYSFWNTVIGVESDLVAAARSLHHRKSGIACILGTGSNSCFYDGHSIIKNVKPLGYILGDEGSGAALGKMFLSDCLKGIIPTQISELFFDRYKLTYEELMHKVYHEPNANRFLASFSLFLHAHRENEYVKSIIYKNFDQFFVRNISQYDYANQPVGFVGSIAVHYSEILTEVCESHQFSISSIEPSAISGLVIYHQ